MNHLEIRFIPYAAEEYVAALRTVVGGNTTTNVLVKPWGEAAATVVAAAMDAGLPAIFFAAVGDKTSLPPQVRSLGEDDRIDVVLLFAAEPDDLSDVLLDYLDFDKGIIVAPKTDRYYQNRPLFLITIPKSGTHLLYELVEAFGYFRGVVCPDVPRPQHWYCVEYSNSHTVARDFFVDTVRRSPFGNRHHPFPRTPAIFLYRNPLDILVSEANYWSKDGAAIFASYLSGLSSEERLLKLVDDPWLLGSIRDRVGQFLPWLDFQNVIPASFEELVGPAGGGDAQLQTKLIWSMQLKLHIPGNPVNYGNKVFNRESATFHSGQIGAYKKSFTERVGKKFNTLPQDFMEILGYAVPPEERGAGGFIAKLLKNRKTSFPVSRAFSNRIQGFRERRLAFSQKNFEDTPITVVENYLGHNVVLFNNKFFAIPQDIGTVDLPQVLSKDGPYPFLSGPDLLSVQHAAWLAKGDGSKRTAGLSRIGNLDLPPSDTPALVAELETYNIVLFRKNFHAIPRAIGEVRLEKDDVEGMPGVYVSPSLSEVLDILKNNGIDLGAIEVLRRQITIAQRKL